MLLSIFSEMPDHRRAQGRMYDLPHLLLFTVLAILSGANSYRTVQLFISANLETLNKEFGVKWKKSPVHTAIRKILIGIEPQEIEKVFRKYSKKLIELNPKEYAFISMDGKMLRGSFDNLNDKRMIQLFSVFLTDQDIILAHEKIDKKTNEIPVAQKLIKELELKGCIFTMDALHCQKKR